MKKQTHVHFMGICGSGCASVAMVAKSMGFKVSGCDQSTDSYYGSELKAIGIPIHEGHSAAHLDEDVDIVAVSPALFDVCPNEPELLIAKEKGILMTWQAFMGAYLQEGKRVIAVSGTHGKTTTTFLTAEMLIEAGLDPLVEGGSVYSKWKSGGRCGASDLFLCEADEFNRNFYHYKPFIAVVNNVEMDHPECFRDFEDVLSAFTTFLTAPKTVRKLIVNIDSPGACEVLSRASSDPVIREADVYLLSRKDVALPDLPLSNPHPVFYETLEKKEGLTRFRFRLDGEDHVFSMRLQGEFNVNNAVTSAVVAKVLHASDADIARALLAFTGAGRRFDKVGERAGVPVFDDYAHHPSEISSLLTMCRDYYPDKKLLAIFEPHQISRLTLMFQGYVDALTIADHVVIWRTHIGREALTGLKPIPKERWESASPRILYEEDEEEIVRIADRFREADECDMILVIGAAASYRVSRRLTQKGED